MRNEILKEIHIFGIISGLLFGLSWNPYFPSISLFLAFIPLFYFQHYFKPYGWDFFKTSFVSFIIFHLATVWWIMNSTIVGFFVVIIINSLLMATAMWLFQFFIKRYRKFIAYISFIFFWLTFEYLHYHWEISWPFMHLGNWFGQISSWIQWYEYTGVAGGSLWVLLVNILLFESLTLFISNKKTLGAILILGAASILILPILISGQIKSTIDIAQTKVNVLIIQPNIDPYKEKYNKELFESQIKDQIKLALNNITTETDLIVYPEASFPLYVNLDSISDNYFKGRFSKLNKRIDIIVGMYAFKVIEKDSTFYNTAICISQNRNPQKYFKSKLVPAVEKTPFSDYFPFLSNQNVNFGGITSSLGTSFDRTVFNTNSVQAAPIICYESVFGEFTANFVKNGAELIVVMTNDAWWGDTPANDQILMHSKLRAIETRRNVIRSANTGVSCLIDQNGTIVNELQMNTPSALNVSAQKNNIHTFYVMNGDFIGKLSLYFSLLMLFLIIISKFVIFFKKK